MGLFEHFPYSNFHDLNLDWWLEAMRELEKRVDELEKRIEQLKEEILKEVDEKLKAFEEKLLQEVQEKLDQLKQELTELINTSIADLETKINEQITNINNRIDQLETKMEECCNELKAAISEIDTQITEINTKISSIELTITNINNEIDTINSRLDAIDKDIYDININISSILDSIGNINTSIEQINNKISTIQTEIRTINTTITQLQTDLESLQQTVSSLSDEVTELQKTVSDHTAEIADHEQRITDLENATPPSGGLTAVEPKYVPIEVDATDTVQTLTAKINNAIQNTVCTHIGLVFTATKNIDQNLIYLINNPIIISLRTNNNVNIFFNATVDTNIIKNKQITIGSNSNIGYTGNSKQITFLGCTFQGDNSQNSALDGGISIMQAISCKFKILKLHGLSISNSNLATINVNSVFITNSYIANMFTYGTTGSIQIDTSIVTDGLNNTANYTINCINCHISLTTNFNNAGSVYINGGIASIVCKGGNVISNGCVLEVYSGNTATITGTKVSLTNI